MEWVIENFFVVNAVVLALLAVYMLWRPKGQGVRLNFSKSPKASELLSLGQDGEGIELRKAKSLNVIFNYNGHSWDAYEVFGLPAGASWEEVERAYNASCKDSDPSSRDFFDTALRAIRQSQ